MKFETIREATEFWVREFSAVSTGMIKDLMYMHPEDWCEVTFTTVNDRICYYGDPTDFDGSSRHGEIISDGEEKDWLVRFDDGIEVELDRSEFAVEYDGFMPMWGTMWQFKDICDKDWIESKAGKKAMSDCGFRIYVSDDYGTFFGIDGCGYDFYESHWIPLYKSRGLLWHREETQ